MDDHYFVDKQAANVQQVLDVLNSKNLDPVTLRNVCDSGEWEELNFELKLNANQLKLIQYNDAAKRILAGRLAIKTHNETQFWTHSLLDFLEKQNEITLNIFPYNQTLDITYDAKLRGKVTGYLVARVFFSPESVNIENITNLCKWTARFLEPTEHLFVVYDLRFPEILFRKTLSLLSIITVKCPNIHILSVNQFQDFFADSKQHVGVGGKCNKETQNHISRLLDKLELTS